MASGRRRREPRPTPGVSRRSFLKGAAGAGAVASGLVAFPDLAFGAPNSVSDENAKPGSPPEDWESSRSATIEGFTTDFSVGSRRDGGLQDPNGVDQLPRSHLPARVVRRARGPTHRRHHPLGVAPADPAGADHERRDGPHRLRQLGDLGDVDRSRQQRVRRLLRPLRAARRRRRAQPHAVRRAPPRTVATSSCRRPRRPGRRTTCGATAASTRGCRGAAYKVSYNRPEIPYFPETDFFSMEYPLVRWLERNGYDVSYCGEHRHAPQPRVPPQPQGVHLLGPRRVLVGPHARQRRGGS